MLYEKDLISNPRSKAKSVGFIDEGLAQAKKKFAEMFGG